MNLPLTYIVAMSINFIVSLKLFREFSFLQLENCHDWSYSPRMLICNEENWQNNCSMLARPTYDHRIILFCFRAGERSEWNVMCNVSHFASLRTCSIRRNCLFVVLGEVQDLSRLFVFSRCRWWSLRLHRVRWWIKVEREFWLDLKIHAMPLMVRKSEDGSNVRLMKKAENGLWINWRFLRRN